MKIIRILGLVVLGILWIWLVRALILYSGGFTLKNIFLIIASGIIIFYPLYKKWSKS
ncbi:MAG: hypothetical protein K2N03_07360 [Muribaculaceae bacterium]|nr:hypothetical protein [Muribaculaceae bacterium]